MKVVLTGYGSRGDIEPGAAMGLELLRRGHDVRMAVPPEMLGFVESAGLPAVDYGPDSQALLHDEAFVRQLSMKVQNPLAILPEVIEHVNRVWTEKAAKLTSLTDDADLLVAGVNEQRLAANVAEFRRVPLVSLHLFPARLWSSEGIYSRITTMAGEAQRRKLGLPETTTSGLPHECLELQAYEELCLPTMASDWVDRDDRHPFIGALTLESPTDADDEVLSWIESGTPPIYFGFGSTPVTRFPDTAAMIGAACAQLGERALVCSGSNDLTLVPDAHHVKVVGAVSHAAVFPACRAVVHHGGAGTTAAGLRAGMPTLVLWVWLDQPMWAAALEELNVGFGRRFSETTEASLVADLRLILSPQYIDRAREVAAGMTKPSESVTNAADLLEAAARAGRSR